MMRNKLSQVGYTSNGMMSVVLHLSDAVSVLKQDFLRNRRTSAKYLHQDGGVRSVVQDHCNDNYKKSV